MELRGDLMRCSRLLFIVIGVLFMTGEAFAGMDVFVYPSKGQTKEQQEQDEFSCYKWAKEQTGFDPTQPMQQTAAPRRAQQKVPRSARSEAPLAATQARERRSAQG